jgi:hypothetical protein
MATTGSAICPYCVGDQQRVIRGEHVVSGVLLTDHTELLRHRDESHDQQVEIAPGVVASRPALREVEIDGLRVTMPAGLRPIFRHFCPVSQQAVTLYADSAGGSVQ